VSAETTSKAFFEGKLRENLKPEITFLVESFVLSAFLFIFAAGFPVPPGVAARYNGLPSF